MEALRNLKTFPKQAPNKAEVSIDEAIPNMK